MPITEWQKPVVSIWWNVGYFRKKSHAILWHAVLTVWKTERRFMYRHWPGLPTMTVTSAIHTKRYSASWGKWTCLIPARRSFTEEWCLTSWAGTMTTIARTSLSWWTNKGSGNCLLHTTSAIHTHRAANGRTATNCHSTANKTISRWKICKRWVRTWVSGNTNRLSKRYRKPYRIGMKLPRIAGSNRNTPTLSEKACSCSASNCIPSKCRTLPTNKSRLSWRLCGMMTSTPSWNWRWKDISHRKRYWKSSSRIYPPPPSSLPPKSSKWRKC